MSKRTPGTFGTLPDWVLAALPTLDPTGMLILTKVAYGAGLKRPAVTLGTLIDYTGRSPKQVDRALRQLTGAGLLIQSSDGYTLGGVPKTGDTDGDRQGDKTGDTDGDKNVQNHTEKVRPTRQTQTPEEVEEEKEDTYSLTDTGLDTPVGEPVRGSVGAKPDQPAPPAPTPPPVSEFQTAAQLFHRVVGANFVNNNSAHIGRWAEQYSEDFIRLAWEIARTDTKLARVPMAGLVWLLDGTKPWPDELRKQFQRDKGAAAASEAGAAAECPQPGEIRICGGRSGRVLDVDHDARKLTLQIGADASESIWVPWSSTQPAVKVSA